MYCFPAFCCDLTKRVDLSIVTNKLPDTLGSNVPECPVFATLKIFLTHVTTSWDDGLGGLSKFITPYLIDMTKTKIQKHVLIMTENVQI